MPYGKLDTRTREMIVRSLAKGGGVRFTAEVIGVELNTVLQTLETVGDMAINFFQKPLNIKAREFQCDELHSFVDAKEHNLPRKKTPSEEAGTTWGYIALVPRTSFVVTYHLGDQDQIDAAIFFRKLKAKLAKEKDGSFQVRPLIVTDGLKAYPIAFQAVFGDDADYGVIFKSYTRQDENGNKLPGARYNGSKRDVIQGNVDLADVHTSHVERGNLNIRMWNRRFTRKTNGFSKRALNHERQLALTLLYSNYCHVLSPIRPELDENGETPRDQNGKKVRWRKRLTPAMEAGVETRIWSATDIVALTDAYLARRRRLQRARKKQTAARKARLALPPKRPVQAPFWVYERRHPYAVKVHRAECVNCRDGLGKGGKRGSASGAWRPFASYDDAEDAAVALAPDKWSTCSMCLGEYRLRGRPAPGLRPEVG